MPLGCEKGRKNASKSNAYLKNLLPKGTVLAFQVLSPILSREGECDRTSRLMTAGVVALCGLSCFLLCFTDSFKGIGGDVFHGIARRGASGSTAAPETAAWNPFRVMFVDFIHAFAPALVFATVAALDHNVVACFCPEPSTRARLLLVSVSSACSLWHSPPPAMGG